MRSLNEPTSSFFLLSSLFSTSSLMLLEAERPCWQAVQSEESQLILMLWYLHYWDSDDLEICDVNRAGEWANAHIFPQPFIMWVPGTAEGALTVPVIPAPSRSFALWLRCNHGSFGRLWKWSKQTEMDGEINSIQCPESAGCTVHLIAPLTDTDHITNVGSGQWGMANLQGLLKMYPSCSFCRLNLWSESAQVRHGHHGQMLGQLGNKRIEKKKKVLY